MTLDPKRKSALVAVKLAALVKSLTGNQIELFDVASGAAGLVHGGAWVLLPDDGYGLGPALLWAAKHEAETVSVVVEEPTDMVSYALNGCASSVEAFVAEGTELKRLSPVGPPDPLLPSPHHPLLGALREAGLDVVAGHGVWHGEINGLEVARLTDEDDGLQLGVGAYDRGAFEALYPDASPIDALDRVVSQVRSHRQPDSAPHLLNRLVRERWLRAAICHAPETVGLVSASAVPGVSARAGLHVTEPDAAVGADDSGQKVLVVTSARVDINVVGHAAALSARETPDRIVFAVDADDLMGSLCDSSKFLNRPTKWVGLRAPWKAA